MKLPDVETEVQRETAQLLDRLEPHLVGYSRAVVLRAAIRLTAAMLGPAGPKHREAIIKDIAPTIQALLEQMDRLVDSPEAEWDPTLRVFKAAYGAERKKQ